MAKEQFIDTNFQTRTWRVIAQAQEIIRQMQAQGYTLTVRQLYYQFVSRGLMENKQANYKRLGDIMDKARKAGVIDWNAIEDRTRYLRSISHYPGPERFLSRQAERYYAEHLWADQDTYCEVWIEKDALIGVIEPACLEWRVPYFACRGYASSSELYEAGKRLARKIDAGKRVVIFHLGDHDPSGLDMTRANREALNLFARTYDIEVERLALNWDQIEEHSPPPNPVKETDSRWVEYSSQYGDECWELDALDPSVIDGLIRGAIEGVVDQDAFDAAMTREKENQSQLIRIADDWNDVSRYMKYRDVEADHAQPGLTVDTILYEFEENERATDDE